MIARPPGLKGTTFSLDTHCGRLYVTVNRHPETDDPIELFCRFGKAGGCGSAVMDGLMRMISLGLQSGMSAESIVKGLSGIACHHGPMTCMDAVAQAVDEVLRGKAAGGPRL